MSYGCGWKLDIGFNVFEFQIAVPLFWMTAGEIEYTKIRRSIRSIDDEECTC